MKIFLVALLCLAVQLAYCEDADKKPHKPWFSENCLTKTTTTEDQLKQFFREKSTPGCGTVSEYLRCWCIEKGVMAENSNKIEVKPLLKIAKCKKEAAKAEEELKKCGVDSEKTDDPACSFTKCLQKNVFPLENANKPQHGISQTCLNKHNQTQGAVWTFFSGNSTDCGNLSEAFHCTAVENGVMTNESDKINTEKLKHMTNYKKDNVTASAELKKCEGVTGKDENEKACNLAICLRDKVMRMENKDKPQGGNKGKKGGKAQSATDAPAE